MHHRWLRLFLGCTSMTALSGYCIIISLTYFQSINPPPRSYSVSIVVIFCRVTGLRWLHSYQFNQHKRSWEGCHSKQNPSRIRLHRSTQELDRGTVPWHRLMRRHPRLGCTRCHCSYCNPFQSLILSENKLESNANACLCGIKQGGPFWRVATGRRDGLVSKASEASSQIPSPKFNFTSLRASFASNGLDVTDLVILSGWVLRLLID